MKPKPTVSQAQAESTTRRQLIYGIQDDNGTDIQNFALDLTPPPDVLVRTREGTSDGMNVLGIVIFSATMGEKEGRATLEVQVSCLVADVNTGPSITDSDIDAYALFL